MLRECKIHGLTEYATRKRGKYSYLKCRKCETKHVKNRRDKIKRKLVDLHGGCCIRCGYSKSLRALTFHHRDARDKDISLSRDAMLAWDKVLAESKKCDLLCANCHMEVHEELDARSSSG